MAKNSFSEGRGPSQRQLRVGELIRRTLSEVLLRDELHDPDITRLSLTVGEVRVTPDLSIATVFVLPLGGDKQEEAIALLARHKGELRRIIGRKAKLKHAPDLRFRIDTTFDQMDATRRMLSDERVQADVAKTDASDAEGNDTP
ncbi:30S ribosome-binding factor RbfA [Shimia marina]|uniref:Ribosome-binding factor A n=1 Tax=Shimia marina TaxID=321267 RepID=A0A0P1ETF6_9RHOB|nr:30S ribosome-binding factor RbfA [Shimia marina]CUH53861.1 Ribosome-binding factor A [Shimia marina]SFE20979.1 ribosome-binding factor A [Shimia marina]